jgi:hypothetical protein
VSCLAFSGGASGREWDTTVNLLFISIVKGGETFILGLVRASEEVYGGRGLYVYSEFKCSI